MANTEYQLEGNAAELYEKFTVPTGARPAAERLLDNIVLSDSDRVLDAACGTGIVARLMAESSTKVASVVGLDLNESMLDVARKLEPPADFSIKWQQGDLCALPFSDAEFDVVLCNHGFQFVPDKPAALNEIKRVLADGGRFAFTVWSSETPMNVAIAASVRRHISEDVAKAVMAPFAFRDDTAIRALLREAGFQSIDMQELTFIRRLPATESAGMELIERSAYAKDVNAASDKVRRAIAEEIYEAMQPYRDGDEFAEPMSNHLAQATRHS